MVLTCVVGSNPHAVPAGCRYTSPAITAISSFPVSPGEEVARPIKLSQNIGKVLRSEGDKYDNTQTVLFICQSLFCYSFKSPAWEHTFLSS